MEEILGKISLMRIKTRRLLLRSHQLSDAVRLNRWENDPILRFYSGDEPIPSLPDSLKSTRGFLKKVVSKQAPEIIRLAICKTSGEFIGYCMIAFIDITNRACKVGITIGERLEWGKGYASEALNAMLGHCFCKLKMYRVGAEIYSFNRRSIGLFKRAGFRREGIIRQALLREGVFVDEQIFGLLRAEWLQYQGLGGC